MTPPRPCGRYPECARPIPADAPARRRWCSESCKTSAYRARRLAAAREAHKAAWQARKAAIDAAHPFATLDH